MAKMSRTALVALFLAAIAEQFTSTAELTSGPVQERSGSSIDIANAEYDFQGFWSDNRDMWTYRSNGQRWLICRRQKVTAITTKDVNITETYQTTKKITRVNDMWSFFKKGEVWKVNPEEPTLDIQHLLYYDKSGPCAVVSYEVRKESDVGKPLSSLVHLNLLAAESRHVERSADKCKEAYERLMGENRSRDVILYSEGCRF